MKKFYGILKETFREYEANSERLSSEVIAVFPLRHEAEAAVLEMAMTRSLRKEYRIVDVFLDRKILADLAKNK